MNVSSGKPLVSIGMPAHNAERYIRQSLDALLAQDYANFELIISDNASTDRTPEICQEYLAKDHRIRYSRNETDLGALKNFNRLFELSSGKYFMWAADHDLWDPTFVSACVSVLEAEPNVVLAYPQTMLIDPDGNSLGLTPDQIDTRGMPAVRRYQHLISNLHWCNMVYGVIRREALAQTERPRKVWGSDMVLLAELAFSGAFAQIAEPLFYRRENRPGETLEATIKRVSFQLDPASADARSERAYEDLWLETGIAHLRVVAYAPIGPLEKLRAATVTILCFRSRFGVRWPGISFAESVAKALIPKSLRQRTLALLHR
jgi:glycosyltransferase involved in cell wall biosynthesis